MKKLLFLSLFLLPFLPALADVRLPAILGDHMVLQQKTTIQLWGWSDPDEKIEVRVDWDSTTYRDTATGFAQWRILIPTPVAGGPYKIHIKGYNNITIEDVLIGEVWLCSGQSNMEMSVKWGLPYEADVAGATQKNIRFFQVAKSTSSTRQDDVKGRWVVCSPEEMKKFSAVGYFFGRKLTEKLDQPVGLIQAAWSGSPAEVWTPEDLIVTDTLLSRAAQQQKPARWWPHLPGAAYNAMIYPLRNYQLAGALWYQGESNVGTAASYTALLTKMITAWRKDHQQEFPFYLVQIAPFEGYGEGYASALLREAQSGVLSLPNTGMIITTDLVDNLKDIHPKLKKEVGERLAALALSQTYHQNGMVATYPHYARMEREKKGFRIYFDGAPSGLISKGGEPTDFYIAGADKKFLKAKAQIKGSTVLVWSDEIKDPVAVRFAFTNAPHPNLFSKEGLPLVPFRTDDWQ